MIAGTYKPPVKKKEQRVYHTVSVKNLYGMEEPEAVRAAREKAEELNERFNEICRRNEELKAEVGDETSEELEDAIDEELDMWDEVKKAEKEYDALWLKHVKYPKFAGGSKREVGRD